MTQHQLRWTRRALPAMLSAAAFGAAGTSFAGDLPPGRYTIVAVHSGKCVDVAAASTADAANVQQVTCNGNTAQVFDVTETAGGYKLLNINSGKAIDVAAASHADGANIQQYSDNGTVAQRFAAELSNGNEFTLRNAGSGKCVDVAAGGTGDGTNIQQWTCNGSSNQRFRFLPLPAAGQAAVPVGRYTLQSAHSGKCLDVAASATNDGANVQQWSCNGTGAQSFQLTAENGHYRLRNTNSGKSLDVADASTTDGANIQQWASFDVDQQRFGFYAQGNRFQIRAKHSGKCLDVAGWSNADGGNVQQWGCGGTQANQQWTLTPAGGTEPPGWVLVWADEFDGSSLDRSKWNYEVNGAGGGNNELQYYTDRTQNVFVQNGKLVIQALREHYCSTDGCRDYTSGRLNSANKGSFLYGRWEARAKLPRGRGIWPAIWALPTDWVYGGWAASGEIDIMEAVNTDAGGGNTVFGSIHYGKPWPGNEHQTKGFTPATSVADHFHVYAMEWEPGEIRIYVDNNLYARYTQWYSSGGAFPAPFNQRFHWVLNLAVGGNWPGRPDGTTQFPQRLEIDYVRVYRK